jgi:hypothetical protein
LNWEETGETVEIMRTTPFGSTVFAVADNTLDPESTFELETCDIFLKKCHKLSLLLVNIMLSMPHRNVPTSLPV